MKHWFLAFGNVFRNQDLVLIIDFLNLLIIISEFHRHKLRSKKNEILFPYKQTEISIIVRKPNLASQNKLAPSGFLAFVGLKSNLDLSPFCQSFTFPRDGTDLGVRVEGVLCVVLAPGRGI